MLASTASFNLSATLFDAHGAHVGATTTILGDSGEGDFSLVVLSPQLWWPAGTRTGPYLYTLEVCLGAMSSCSDVYRLRVGLRTIKAVGGHILINDHPVYLRGVHANADSSIAGLGQLQHYAARDAELLKWLGANLLRHTAPPEALLDACDALQRC